MRYWLVLLLLTWCLPSFGQSYAFLQAATPDTTDATTYTFSAQNLGTAAADRYIVVASACRATTSLTISSITVGGVTATIVANDESQVADDNLAIAIAAVPTGTTGDVVVTYSGTALRCNVCLWRVTGLASATPTATDTDRGIGNSDDPATSLTVSDGFAIGIASNPANSSATWTGMTERYDATLEGGFFTVTTADAATTSAGSPLAVDCDIAGATANASVGVFASWEFSSGGSTIPLIHYYRQQMGR